MARISLKLLVVLCLISFFWGCAKKQPLEPAPKRVYITSQDAPVPAGVIRQCWEEPIVQLEANGPGLDVAGEWYHPSYLAVRETRQGKWRPCKPMPSEIDGEIKNER